MPKLERTTFTLTQQQIEWIDEQSKKTGLLKAEIMRRAVDQYAEQEEAKEERQFFYTRTAERDQRDRTGERCFRTLCYPQSH